MAMNPVGDFGASFPAERLPGLGRPAPARRSAAKSAPQVISDEALQEHLARIFAKRAFLEEPAAPGRSERPLPARRITRGGHINIRA